jgi:hypothetical protein
MKGPNIFWGGNEYYAAYLEKKKKKVTNPHMNHHPEFVI